MSLVGSETVLSGLNIPILPNDFEFSCEENGNVKSQDNVIHK